MLFPTKFVPKKITDHFLNNYFATICTKVEAINLYYPSFKAYLNNPQNKILNFALINNDINLLDPGISLNCAPTRVCRKTMP